MEMVWVLQWYDLTPPKNGLGESFGYGNGLCITEKIMITHEEEAGVFK